MSLTPTKGPGGDRISATYDIPEGDVLSDPKIYPEVSAIGSGAYGTVYKARDGNNPGMYVALKKIRVELRDEGVPISTLREISMLRQLERCNHPNIVRLLDICHGSRLKEEQQLVLILVFEHVEQDLHQYMVRSPEALSSSRIKDLMFQIVCGVDFLHCNRILHRDLKPQNILVTTDGVVKIADFGMARLYAVGMVLSSVVVTQWYRAPEVLLCSNYATPVDLWSIGCIFAELVRREPLFNGATDADQLHKIFDIMGSPHQDEWPRGVSVSWQQFRGRPGVPLSSLLPELEPSGQDLLRQMLTFVPEKRISAVRALRHSYFDGRTPPLSGPVPATLTSPASAASGPVRQEPPSSVDAVLRGRNLMASTPISSSDRQASNSNPGFPETPQNPSGRAKRHSAGTPSNSPESSLSCSTSDESGQSMEQ